MHYVLSALVEKGLIKLSNFSRSPQKRRYAYVLTPKGMSERLDLTRMFLLRKQEEYFSLRAEIEALYAELKNGPSLWRNLGSAGQRGDRSYRKFRVSHRIGKLCGLSVLSETENWELDALEAELIGRGRRL